MMVSIITEILLASSAVLAQYCGVLQADTQQILWECRGVNPSDESLAMFRVEDRGVLLIDFHFDMAPHKGMSH